MGWQFGGGCRTANYWITTVNGRPQWGTPTFLTKWANCLTEATRRIIIIIKISELGNPRYVFLRRFSGLQIRGRLEIDFLTKNKGEKLAEFVMRLFFLLPGCWMLGQNSPKKKGVNFTLRSVKIGDFTFRRVKLAVIFTEKGGNLKRICFFVFFGLLRKKAAKVVQISKN